eukprot:EG_transcript_19546
MRRRRWLLAACLLPQTAAQDCYGVIQYCDENPSGSAACLCRGTARWCCYAGEVCGNSFNNCISQFYFTLVGVVSIAIAVTCCVAIAALCFYWWVKRRRITARLRMLQQAPPAPLPTPIEGIALHFTMDQPQPTGVPVDGADSCDCPPPAASARSPVSGGPGRSSMARSPSQSSVHNFGPLVRSGSQGSLAGEGDLGWGGRSESQVRYPSPVKPAR